MIRWTRLGNGYRGRSMWDDKATAAQVAKTATAHYGFPCAAMLIPSQYTGRATAGWAVVTKSTPPASDIID